MCYSNEYRSSDGNPNFFRIGLTTQLSACKTSFNMKGGKKIKSKSKTKTKSKSKSKAKTRAIFKRKTKRQKNISLY